MKTLGVVLATIIFINVGAAASECDLSDSYVSDGDGLLYQELNKAKLKEQRELVVHDDEWCIKSFRRPCGA